MTFLDRQTTREAQQVRKSRRKYDTPDRPGTALAYSQTGSSNGAQGEMARALKAAGLAPEKRKPRNRKRPHSPVKPGPNAAPSAVAAMHRVAKGK